MARSLVRLARRGSAISFSCESFISLGQGIIFLVWAGLSTFTLPKGGVKLYFDGSQRTSTQLAESFLTRC